MLKQLTFPFNIVFSRFHKKNEVLPSSIIFIGNHGQIMGRSWADHGQTIGDRFMQKNPANISFFRYRFFREVIKIYDFPQKNNQSVNLFFPPDVNKADLHNVHMLAWAKNLKTLYYLRSEAISRADNVTSQAKREIIFEQSDCLSCEG